MEISLYIHIPFCRHKCPYCHFFVVKAKQPLIEQYLSAWKLEWKRKLPLTQNKKVVSIYFGGGTPPMIGISNLASLLQTIFQDVEVSSDLEITLEANPEDVSVSFIQEVKKLGVNRISIGIQSLDNSNLEVLDRRHNAQKAIHSIELTYQGGIENISVDLMYDLPGQILPSWQSTLDQIAKLPISHLSLYNLTIEPNTVFHKKQRLLLPTLPSEETSLAMLEYACDFLFNNNLERYEISAFAKNGQISRHNTGYWTARPFLGYGPSAFSFFEKKRFRNVANIQKYQKLLEKGEDPLDFEEQLEYPHNLHELLTIELRLIKGVSVDLFQKKHGELPQETLQTIELLKKQGYLEPQQEFVKLTKKGLLFYDTVAIELI